IVFDYKLTKVNGQPFSLEFPLTIQDKTNDGVPHLKTNLLKNSQIVVKPIVKSYRTEGKVQIKKWENVILQIYRVIYQTHNWFHIMSGNQWPTKVKGNVPIEIKLLPGNNNQKVAYYKRADKSKGLDASITLGQMSSRIRQTLAHEYTHHIEDYSTTPDIDKKIGLAACSNTKDHHTIFMATNPCQAFSEGFAIFVEMMFGDSRQPNTQTFFQLKPTSNLQDNVNFKKSYPLKAKSFSSEGAFSRVLYESFRQAICEVVSMKSPNSLNYEQINLKEFSGLEINKHPNAQLYINSRAAKALFSAFIWQPLLKLRPMESVPTVELFVKEMQKVSPSVSNNLGLSSGVQNPVGIMNARLKDWYLDKNNNIKHTIKLDLKKKFTYVKLNDVDVKNGISLEQLFQGKTAVMFEVSESWCPGCKILLKELRKKRLELENKGLIVAYLNRKDAADAKLTPVGKRLPHWLVAPKWLSINFDFKYMPYMILVNKKGLVLYHGQAGYKELIDVLAKDFQVKIKWPK
ncbi:MAG: redoxin domain-containing protein, partial [Nitrospina sp.]|nr:redoxin domain-containing protein [Nitrospina sp.]